MKGKKYEIGDKVVMLSFEDLTMHKGMKSDTASKIAGKEAVIVEIHKPNEISNTSYTLDITGYRIVCTKGYFRPYSEKDEVQSKKNDRQDNKLMWELLPLDTIEEAVKVFTFGAQKYGVNTWQNLPDGFERYRDAMLRHMVAHLKGEETDNESGLPHLSHMLWNAIAMVYIYKRDKK